MPRPVAELIAIILATAVAVSLVASVVGLVLIRLDDPAADLTAAASGVGSILAALVGYVVGSRSRR